MAGQALATLVEILGLEDARNGDDILKRNTLAINLHRTGRRHFLLTFSIIGNSRDGKRATLLRNVLEGVRSLRHGLDQQIIGIDIYLADGAGIRLGIDGDGNTVTSIDGRGLESCHTAVHALVFLIAAKGQAIDIEATLVNEQGEHVATCLQLCLQPYVHRLPVISTTRAGNVHIIADKLQVVERVLSQMEHTASLCRSDSGIKRIRAVLHDIHGIVHPLAILRRCGDISRGIRIGHATGTKVVFCCADCTRQLRNAVFEERLMLGSRGKHVDTAIALIGRTVSSRYYCLRVIPAGLRRGIFNNIRSLRHGLHQFIVHVEVNLLNGLGGQTGTYLDRKHVTFGSFQGSGTDIDRGLFLCSREGADSIFGGIACHILLDPCHSRTLTAVSIKS